VRSCGAPESVLTAAVLSEVYGIAVVVTPDHRGVVTTRPVRRRPRRTAALVPDRSASLAV
jgi:ABC-type cobalamin/Fe3+-siderophores transport system ATPase subunit